MARGKNKVHRMRTVCAMVGVLGIAVSFALYFIDHRMFFEAWLMSWFYWFSLAVGCLGFYQIYRLTGGEWGDPLERIFLAGGTTFNPLLILFLPLLGGFRDLYLWAQPALVAADTKLQHKHAYLNVGFWEARAAFYFVCWIVLSHLFLRSSKENTLRLSSVGIILLFLSVSFASVDWLMSLEPIWYSTIYGLIILTGQGMASFAFGTLLLYWIRSNVPGWFPQLSSKALKDIGNIQLTACIVWAYVSFVQWLILWIGNIPETVTWYVSRASHGWDVVAWVVFFGQFLVPLQLLVWQAFKEKPRNIAALGALLLGVHLVEIYWLVVPALHPSQLYFNWMLLITFPAIGGLWLAWFFRQLRELDLRNARSEFTPLLREVLHA